MTPTKNHLTCNRCGWPWDGLGINGKPAIHRDYCNVCWYTEVRAMSPVQLKRVEELLAQHPKRETARAAS
jgi:ribosomal protein L37E